MTKPPPLNLTGKVPPEDQFDYGVRITRNSIEWRAVDDPLHVAEAVMRLVEALEKLSDTFDYNGVAQDALAEFEKAILEK